jgi:hypothetical protein
MQRITNRKNADMTFFETLAYSWPRVNINRPKKFKIGITEFLHNQHKTPDWLVFSIMPFIKNLRL